MAEANLGFRQFDNNIASSHTEWWPQRIWAAGNSTLTTVCDWCMTSDPIAASVEMPNYANVAVYAVGVILEAMSTRARIRRR